MRVVIIIAVLFFIPAIGLSATYYVPDDFPTIQGALSDASVVNGDIIIVRASTYVENIDFLGKAITLMSEEGPDVTIIDGNMADSVVTCRNGEDEKTVLDGFTLTNGSGYSPGGSTYGGGMLNHDNCSPTVTHCIFTGNTASFGGGMYNIYYSSPTVTHCTFSENTANSFGGGMINWENCSPTVTHCTFSGNSADWGSAGGMLNYDNSNPVVTYCTFSENQADSGGGMENSGSSPTVTHCIFVDNHLPTLDGHGGGMDNFNSSPIVSNCIFKNNLIDYGDGGGMRNHVSSYPLVINCFFSGNEAEFGGGMSNFIDSDPTVINCTFSGNLAGFGGGMHSINDCLATVTNCIFWNDTPDEIYNAGTSPATVTYSCVQGGHLGVGNLDSDPLFVDEAGGDFHLTFNSPCRASGDDTAVTELYDFEDDPRIAYGTVDMGADEFYTHLYYTGDATPGGSVEVKFVGLPGTSPVIFFIGSGVLDPPVSTMYGDWYLDSPLLFVLYLGSIATPSGVTVLSYTFDLSFPAVVLPMQALINAELTNLSVMEVE